MIHYVMDMKKTCMVLSILLLAVASSSCGKKPEQSSKPEQLTPMNAAEQYSNVMIRARKTAEGMDAVLPMQQLVDSYLAEKGRYPASLQEMTTDMRAKELPQPPAGMEYTYDPSNGRVALKNSGGK